MKQKHFMDIEVLREKNSELRSSNACGFKAGDLIQITEKYDGSNACATFNLEEGNMAAFSRKQELSFHNTLNGFWNYIQNLSIHTKKVFEEHPNYRVFGEWSNKNKIIYDDTNKVLHWYVYDIYDIEKKEWLKQDIVKEFCLQTRLEYIHELYLGPFISWDHCRSFMNLPYYGPMQEGIVVKNQDRLNDSSNHLPFYLKMVNQDYLERKSIRERKYDPEIQKQKEYAHELVASIITQMRVEKMIYKLRDEQLIPEKLTAKDLSQLAKLLPLRLYEDCLKEDHEVVKECGEYFSKSCSNITMKHAKAIILNNS